MFVFKLLLILIYFTGEVRPAEHSAAQEGQCRQQKHQGRFQNPGRRHAAVTRGGTSGGGTAGPQSEAAVVRVGASQTAVVGRSDGRRQQYHYQ